MMPAFFETSNSPKNLVNLKSITIRLFGTYCNDPMGTFVNQDGGSDTDGDSGEDDVFMTAGRAPKRRLGMGWNKYLCAVLRKIWGFTMVVVGLRRIIERMRRDDTQPDLLDRWIFTMK